MRALKSYMNIKIKFSAELQRKHTDRYGEKVVSFRTILETIQKF